MQVLLCENADIFAGCQANAEYKKALRENSGKWLEVETEYLFENQYNVSFGRIFDNMVAAVRDDARLNMGRCKYCGALVRKGEEEKHFAEKEKEGCSGCWYYRFRRYGEKTIREEKRIDNGVEFITRQTWEEEKQVCTYCESEHRKADCNKKECREWGINWFTPENTFFLRYPYGLPAEKVIFNRECLKIKSYFLDFLDVGKYYRLSNGRCRIDFYIDNNLSGLRRIIKKSWGNSYRDERIPADVRNMALAIIDFRKMLLQAIIDGGGAAAEYASLQDLNGAATAILRRAADEKGGDCSCGAFCDWLGGLPGCCLVPFETYKQKEILKNLGYKNLRRCNETMIADLFYGAVLDVLQSWQKYGNR